MMETSAYPGYLVQERYPGLLPWRTLNSTVGKGIWMFLVSSALENLQADMLHHQV